MRKLLLLLLICFLSASSVPAQTEKQPSMKDWTYPYPVQYQKVLDAVDIAYIEKGDGPHTLLFVHGLGSYLKAWNKNIEVLSKSYRCIAIDLPGYGKSSQGDYPYDMEFFAQSVANFIEAQQLDQPTLLGHSMGGQIALTLARQRPDLIQDLVLLAPAGFETFTTQDSAWLTSVFTAGVIENTPEAQIVRNFELNFYDMPDDARFMIEDRLYLRKTSEYKRYCAMIPRCVRGMLQQPVFTTLPAITLPTLVLYGEEDMLIPNRYLHPQLTTEQVAQAGVRKLPNAVLQMLPKAGHFVQWEQSEQVNKRIKAFLER